MMPPTIRDVSNAANVSPSTVSRVLNGTGRIAEPTRRRVEAVMRQMSYERQPPGRRPQNGRKVMNVAIVQPDAERGRRQFFSFCGDWAMGIHDAFKASGAKYTSFVGGRHVDDDQLLRKLVEKGEFDGMVLMAERRRDGYLAWAVQTGIPLVVINRRPEREEFSYVTANNFQGGWKAAEYLVELGHRTLAYVDFTEDVASLMNHHRDRRAGFEACLEEKGLEVRYYGDVDPQKPDAASVMATLARELYDAGATAVLAHNDDLAVQLIEAMAKQQINVPGDVSIMGFDPSPEFQLPDGRRITTIGHDRHGLGRRAAEMLANLIGNTQELSFLGASILPHIIRGDTTVAVSVDGAHRTK